MSLYSIPPPNHIYRIRFGYDHSQIQSFHLNMPAKIRSVAWFGTIWDEQDLLFVQRLHTRYTIISALDETEESHENDFGKKIQKNHWHAVVIFMTNQGRPKTKNTHWEKCKNTIQCINYCKDKGEPTTEKGEPPKGMSGDIQNKFT